MHINTLYCSTYSPNNPITGHMDIKTDAGVVTVHFNEDECKRIQDIAVAAYIRQASKIVEELTTKTPALVALPAPEPEGEEATFEEIPF